MSPLSRCRALTFDLFGTVLDLGGSLTPALESLLGGRAAGGAAAFWQQLRYRQRLEQYQDSLMMLGHGGYLETARRAFSYVARAAGFTPSAADFDTYLDAWERLDPFPECRAALQRLRGHYRLVALSNGDAPYLQRLVAGRIRVAFDAVISVDAAGAFKPHPAVYRAAARELRLEVGSWRWCPPTASTCSAHAPAGCAASTSTATGCRTRKPSRSTCPTPPCATSTSSPPCCSTRSRYYLTRRVS